jgi:hypothetical protein
MESFRKIVIPFMPLKHHVELNKCNFTASASSASMIVLFSLYSTNNLAAIFLALMGILSTVIGTGGY